MNLNINEHATANVNFAYHCLDTSSIIYIRLLNSDLPLLVFHLTARNNQIIQGRFILSHLWRVFVENIAFPISRKMRKYTIMHIFRSHAIPRSRRRGFSPQKGPIKALDSNFISINRIGDFFLVSYVICLFFSLNATFNRMAVCLHYFEHITCACDLKNKPVNSDHASRTSCLMFPH